MGYRRATVCALPLLRTSPSPAIVNTSSCSETSRITQRAAYSASKGAIHSMTLSIAADLVHEGIRVNGVVPGRSEAHTSELQLLMRISYAVFCLNKKTSFQDKSDGTTAGTENDRRNNITNTNTKSTVICSHL